MGEVVGLLASMGMMVVGVVPAIEIRNRDRLGYDRDLDYLGLLEPPPSRRIYPQTRSAVVHAITSPEPLTKRARRRLKGKR